MSCKLSCECCKKVKKDKNGKKKKRVKNAASPEDLQRAAVRLVNGEGNIQCKNKYQWQVRSSLLLMSLGKRENNRQEFQM